MTLIRLADAKSRHHGPQYHVTTVLDDTVLYLTGYVVGLNTLGSEADVVCKGTSGKTIVSQSVAGARFL